MNISDCSFHKLPYSDLFKTYISDFQKLKQFYPYDPFSEEDILKRAGSLKSFSGREQTIKALSAYHRKLGLKNQQDQLVKLSNENALCVITGQQLGIYGGPLFTVYKIITAILLARKYEQLLKVPVVPVFWMADEDHDFDEIAWLGIPGKDDFKKFYLNEEGDGGTVFNQHIPESMQSFNGCIKDELFETEFTKELWKQLQSHYSAGKSYGEAFAGLISEWFSGEGLLIAGSNHPEIKKLIAPHLYKSIEKADAIYDAIEEQSKKMEAEYHRQVINGDSNLFYLSEQEGRVKIQKKEHCWVAGSIKWKEELLLDEIQQQPEKFSPNVFLRPIIQDKILPNLGYVSGPGELAYYGQMKELYNFYELEMPPIFPRLTATIIESSIARILEKLPFEIQDYDKRLEDLEQEYIEQIEKTDLDAVFQKWKAEVKESASEPLKVIEEIDATLNGTAGKTLAGFENELDKLKGRVYRSLKKQQETQINRIEKIKVNLFPDGGLQERAVSPIYIMNKYSLHVWKDLLKALEEKELDLSKHYFIEL